MLVAVCSSCNWIEIKEDELNVYMDIEPGVNNQI